MSDFVLHRMHLQQLPEPDVGCEDDMFERAVSAAADHLESTIEMFGDAGLNDVGVLYAFLCALANKFVPAGDYVAAADCRELQRRSVAVAMNRPPR